MPCGIGTGTGNRSTREHARPRVAAILNLAVLALVVLAHREYRRSAHRATA